MPNFATSKQISAATSAFAIFIACLVLVGWGLDIAILKSVFPGAATMKANTAVCFILAGLSLWLTGRGGGDGAMGGRGDSPQIVPRPEKKTLRRYRVLVAQTCAIASSTIAILTLSQYLFGWNLGIDELLFRDSPLSPATSHPGRMGINTAINFSLVGGALLLLHKGESESGQKDNLILLAQGLSLGAILIAVQAIVGYAYKVEVFYKFSTYTTSMALHTSVAFVALGVGVLFARPERGLIKIITSDLNGGIVARRMIPSAIALPLILCWIILQGQQANYYDPAFGMSLLAVLMCAIYIALIWRNAAFLNQLDGKRFRAEVAVRESEARYSILAENVPEILFTNLPDGWNDYTSPRFYEYTGMPPGSAEGFGWMGALHPDDAEPSRLQWMESLQTGQIFEIEYRFRRADGVYRWFKGRCIPLRDEGGKIKKWFGVCTDIDDQKRTSEQLRQSQERLQRMVETAQIGIAFASSTGEVFEANNALLELLGYTREEMFSPGLNWHTLTPPEYGEINFQAIAELAQTGEFNSVEKELFRKDGSRLPVLVSGTRIDGEPDEHVAFIVDLSDRKRSEAALQESEAKFRRIFESNIVGIYFGNFSGEISEANDAFLEMFGYTRNDLQAGILRWDSMTPPEYQALDREKIQELQTAGICTPFEKEYMRKDGRRIPIILAIALMPERENDGYSVCFVLDISQQKQIQAELQQSETRLKIALEATKTVCWERDLTSNSLIFTTKAKDPAKLQVISYSEELTWIHPDDREKVHQANESAIANKGYFEVEHRLRETPDRDWRWVLAKGKVLADETGKPTRIIGVSVDITERKKAEFSIKRSEERLQLFVESDLIGLSAGDEHGNLREANDAYLKIIGYTREDFCAGKVRWNELTPPEYLPLDFAAIAEARAKGTSSYYEKEYIRKDGTRVPVLMGCAAFGESGEELMAFTLEISDRKIAEAALRQSEERLRLALEAGEMGAWEWNIQTNAVHWNAIQYQLCGISPDRRNLSADTFMDLIHAEDLASVKRALNQALEEGTDYQAQFRIIRGDGKICWLVGKGSVIRDRNGKPLQMIGVNFDITSNKQIESQLRQLNETLEERVKQRTTQLEATNKELESFSYSVSHDLRAPLRHITGFVDLLRKRLEKTALDDTSRHYIEVIVEATKQAGKLIDDLLAFSRMGRAEMRYSTVDMNLLLREVQHDLESETKNREINWRIEPLPQVKGDSSMLRLVIRNLLENALKYSRTRPIAEITVASTSSDAEVVFFVRDNGVGFDMRYVHKLCRRFSTPAQRPHV